MRVKSTRLSTSTRAGLTAAVSAIGLLMAACGGADDTTQASSGGAVSSVPAAPRTASPSAGSGAFCDAVKAQFAQLSAVGDASSVDAAVRQRYFVTQKDLNAKVRQTAPSGLRKDVEIHTGASDALADARIRGEAAATSAAITLVSAPETRAAGARVSAHVTEHCGLANPGGG